MRLATFFFAKDPQPSAPVKLPTHPPTPKHFPPPPPPPALPPPPKSEWPWQSCWQSPRQACLDSRCTQSKPCARPPPSLRPLGAPLAPRRPAAARDSSSFPRAVLRIARAAHFPG